VHFWWRRHEIGFLTNKCLSLLCLKNSFPSASVTSASLRRCSTASASPPAVGKPSPAISTPSTTRQPSASPRAARAVAQPDGSSSRAHRTRGERRQRLKRGALAAGRRGGGHRRQGRGERLHPPPPQTRFDPRLLSARWPSACRRNVSTDGTSAGSAIAASSTCPASNTTTPVNTPPLLASSTLSIGSYSHTPLLAHERNVRVVGGHVGAPHRRVIVAAARASI
jgi:hypothetical protein